MARSRYESLLSSVVRREDELVAIVVEQMEKGDRLCEGLRLKLGAHIAVVIGSRWLSPPLAFAGELRPPRLNHHHSTFPGSSSPAHSLRPKGGRAGGRERRPAAASQLCAARPASPLGSSSSSTTPSRHAQPRVRRDARRRRRGGVMFTRCLINLHTVAVDAHLQEAESHQHDDDAAAAAAAAGGVDPEGQDQGGGSSPAGSPARNRTPRRIVYWPRLQQRQAVPGKLAATPPLTDERVRTHSFSGENR
jgi:hypothetical protein